MTSVVEVRYPANGGAGPIPLLDLTCIDHPQNSPLKASYDLPVQSVSYSVEFHTPSPAFEASQTPAISTWAITKSSESGPLYLSVRSADDEQLLCWPTTCQSVIIHSSIGRQGQCTLVRGQYSVHRVPVRYLDPKGIPANDRRDLKPLVHKNDTNKLLLLERSAVSERIGDGYKGPYVPDLLASGSCC